MVTKEKYYCPPEADREELNSTWGMTACQSYKRLQKEHEPLEERLGSGFWCSLYSCTTGKEV